MKKPSKPRSEQAVNVMAFPPRRDYASLSLHDLLDARDAYHVYLSSLSNVVATAVGRYRIRKHDWYATHAPDEPRPKDAKRDDGPRTLANSIVRPWSWPAVLVFVRDWAALELLGSNAIPPALYLPDGRVVPTCVILATPDESLPPAPPGPSQVSSLLGGGYSCLREAQGLQGLGTFACLVHREGTYYALTNRHVAGDVEQEVKAFTHGDYHRVGASAKIGVSRALMSDVFPGWPGTSTYLTLDAGLVRVDNLNEWTAQAYGIGEIGEMFDATKQSVTLDLIGCPLRAFGGTSGVMEGEIQALFYRYKSQGGFDHATDLLIGPRSVGRASVPFTAPGDSGTLWFYDPPLRSAAPSQHGHTGPHAPFERGKNARRLQPIAMQWGGERMRLEDGTLSAFASASFLSTICDQLEIELVRDWSTGHDEYWGKVGHFSIGWKACNYVSGALKTLLAANQERLGFDDATISQGSEFRVGRQGFVPLADVPDYVWIAAPGRPSEPIQHFADIDIVDINGGPSMLERCFKDPTQISATVWKQYFDGFKQQGVGPEEGALPFRVWQLWEEMVGSLKNGDVLQFLAAGGVMAHYVGDASQPLHCSWLHHGMPPTTKIAGREYPVPRDSPEFLAFKKTRPAQIHGIYEENMLEVDTASALAGVDQKIGKFAADGRNITSGHDAAVQVIRVMHDSQARLSPTEIIAADDSTQSAAARAQALWDNRQVRDATIQSLADSTMLLADLWTAAWQAGGGDKLKKSELIELAEADLMKVYRDTKFAESLSLADMASSGNFEPSPSATSQPLARTTKKKAKPRKAPPAAKAPTKKAPPRKTTQKKAKKKARKA
jgi:hypothetical protein